MAASRRLLAALVALLAAAGSASAADLCEGCWEVGGRGAYFAPSASAGEDPTGGIGGTALFRFRPYWAVEFAYDRYPGSIPDGPDETLSFLTISGNLTLRSARDQRTRPYLLMGAGFVSDFVSSGRRTVEIQGSKLTASSNPASAYGIVYLLGGGALTSLSPHLWLRFEARWVHWETFSTGQSGLQLGAGLWYRF